MNNISNFQFPPPKNWQDFESLCRDLWCEIWKDPNTQKNGRSGQEQYGVDIYGRPNEGKFWAGVQCKGKDSYTNKIVTEKELLTEVEKAKNFTPKLSQWILATTSVRDAKIQQKAREITNEHKKKGLFSVHIRFWDDILEDIGKYSHLVEEHFRQIGPHNLRLPLNVEFNFPALIKAKTKNFTGRLWLFDKIVDWHNSNFNNHLMFLGIPGYGKTSFVAKSIHKWYPNIIAGYHFCEADTPFTIDPTNFLRNISVMLMKNIPEFKNAVSNKEFEKLINSDFCKTNPKDVFQLAILDPLTIITDQPRCFIVIDALEESLLSDTEIKISDLLAAKQKVFPPWLRLLITARDDSNIRRDFTHGFLIFDLDTDSSNNKRDVQEFISNSIDEMKYEATFTKRGWSKGDITQIIADKSNGNFLYAAHALKELENLEINHPSELPRGLDGLYFSFFKRKFPASEKFNEVRSLLEVLVTAREPLSKAHLSFILSESVQSVSKKLNLISQYLDKRNEKYSLFHKSFNDWLMSESQISGDYAIEIERGNTKIGKACAISLKENNQFIGYASSNVIPHLIAGNCEDELYELLHFEISKGKNFAISHIKQIFIGLRGHERSVSVFVARKRLSFLKRILNQLEIDFLKEHHISEEIQDELVMAILQVNVLLSDRHAHSTPKRSLEFLALARYNNKNFIKRVSHYRRRAHVEMAAIILFKTFECCLDTKQHRHARRALRWSLYLRRVLAATSADIVEELSQRDAVIWCLISLGNYVSNYESLDRKRTQYIEMAHQELLMLESKSNKLQYQNRLDRSRGTVFSALASIRPSERKQLLIQAINAYNRVYNRSMDDRYLVYSLGSAMGHLCNVFLNELDISNAKHWLSEAKLHLVSCLNYEPDGNHSYERLSLRLNWSEAVIKFYEVDQKMALRSMHKIIASLEELSRRWGHIALERDLDKYTRELLEFESLNENS